MLKEVIEFNRLRNGFAYNADLEIEMFNEEVKEFFDADTTHHRVDALIDTQFVKLGTMCKLAYNGLDPEKDMPYPHKDVIDIMMNAVQNELGHNYLRVIKEAERIVCECNAEKNKEKSANGKVSKAGMKRNATIEIASMLAAIKKEEENQDKIEE